MDGTTDTTQTFYGVAGSSFNVSVNAVESRFTPQLQVLYPDGSVACGHAAENNEVRCGLSSPAQTGLYTLKIVDANAVYNSPKTAINYTAQLQMAGQPYLGAGSGSIAWPGLTVSGTANKSFVDQYAFEAVSGTAQTVTLSISSGVTGIDIYDAAGSAVISRTGYSSFSFTPTSSGLFTAFVYNSNIYNLGIQPSYTLAITGSALPALAKNDGAPNHGTSADGAEEPECECNGQAFVGAPINVASGNMSEQATDYTTTGTNPLSFVRYYNSLSQAHGLYPTMLGPNWRSNFDRYLRLFTTSLVAAERADGQVINFALVSGVWKSDSDIDVTLTNSGSTWTLTNGDDTVETYTTSSGVALLNSIKLRNGYKQTLSYSGSQVTGVMDSYSRSLAFTFTGGVVTEITTPDTLVLTYGYTAVGTSSLLKSVGFNTSPATSKIYLYENAALPYALTGITDENGNSYGTWTYDGVGRSTSSKLGGTLNADYTQIAYNDGDGSRAVMQPLGEVDSYKFTMLQGVEKVAEIERAGSGSIPAATRTFAYDSKGYLNSTTDWNGNLTTYVNNAHGQPTTINEGVVSSTPTRTTVISYDPTWVHLPHSITTTGLTTSNTYDPATGDLLTRTLTDTATTTAPYATTGQTRTWTYTWGNYGLLTTVKGPRTDLDTTASFTYDSSAALIKITNALSQSVTIREHTPGGLPQTIVDANGVTAQLVYDQRQRLTSRTLTTSDGALKTSYSYDAAGNLQSTTLPDSSTLTNTYDTAHRLTKVTDALGNHIQYTLDALGNRTETDVYSSGNTLTQQSFSTFDAFGRDRLDTAGDGQTLTRSFDGNGNALTVTDGLGNKVTNTFDALNRLKTTKAADNGVTTPTYDSHDRITAVQDANGNSTLYVRDGFGDVIQLASPDSGITIFHYDGDANLISKKDALGIVTNQSFDALDRLLTTVYPAHTAENVTRTYDQTDTGFAFGVGRLTSVTDAAGSLTRAYDERGNLTLEQRVSGTTTRSTGYSYDRASRIAYITYPDGTLVTYARDAAGFISTVSAKPSGSAGTVQLATLTHQPFGLINAATYGNGIAETWNFNLAYRATNITDGLSSTTLQNLTYAYDLAANVKSITDAVNATNTQSFDYDPQNRLKDATSGLGGYGALAWTYDKVGNRLTQVQGTTTTTYGYTPGTNRLLTISTATTGASLRLPPQQPRYLTHDETQTARTTPRSFDNTSSSEVRYSNNQEPTSTLVLSLGWPLLLIGFGGAFRFRKRLAQNRPLSLGILISLFGGSTLVIIGCGASSTARSGSSGIRSSALAGNVHGGQQPVAGAVIKLYAVGTTGDGSPATPLLNSPVLTDAGGNFSITGDYTCPASSTEVYLVATGGNPGLPTGANNAAIALTSALGPCGSLSSSTFIVVNELSTIGSLAALYPYTHAATSIGSGTSDAAQLAAAFATVNQYINTATGTAPGPSLPAGYYASSTEMDTFGDFIASCINSAGGVAGDSSSCGNLFSLATPSGGISPTDTIQAILNILNHPSANVMGLFNLSSAAVPFQPSLSAAPPDWTLPILPIPATPTFSLPAGSYGAAQTVNILDTTVGAAIYYTTDGSVPTTASHLYSGALTVSGSEMLQAVAIEGGRLVSPVLSATYTIGGSGSSITVATNANGNITIIPPANSAAYATFSYNNANRLASVTGSPLAVTYIYYYAGQRFSKANSGSRSTVYSYGQDSSILAEDDGGSVIDYVYADGRPIAILQPGITPAVNQVSYVLADGLGTPQRIVNSSGSTVWSAAYQPFGTTAGTDTAAITQNLRLPGQLADGETGFSYNLNRDYMPNLGRYLESDPSGLRGGSNTYAYVGNSPGRSIDPLGLDGIGADGVLNITVPVGRIPKPILPSEDLFGGAFTGYGPGISRKELADDLGKIGEYSTAATLVSIGATPFFPPAATGTVVFGTIAACAEIGQAVLEPTYGRAAQLVIEGTVDATGLGDAYTAAHAAGEILTPTKAY